MAVALLLVPGCNCWALLDHGFVKATSWCCCFDGSEKSGSGREEIEDWEELSEKTELVDVQVDDACEEQAKEVVCVV
jgi:phage terminase Nu1 subunit (DNA packaging protein)